MRTSHVLCALVGLALAPAALTAQGAPAAGAAASDSLPAEPRRSPVHFLLFGVQHGAKIRTSVGLATPTERDAGMTGFEVTLQPRNGGIGLSGRMLSESDGLEQTEGSLLIGSRKFSIDAAYVMRTGFHPAAAGPYDSTYAFARGGFRSRANLGNTGFTLMMRVGYYVKIPKDELLDPELEGWDGETGLSWTWSKFPLTAMLGYRIERFKVFTVEQEVSSLIMGAGVAFGRR